MDSRKLIKHPLRSGHGDYKGRQPYMTLGMARVCLWLATCALTAQAIDLAALRRNAPLSSPTLPTQIYAHYMEPLGPADFLPLCGNGRIDNATDYERYYATHPSWTAWPMYPGSGFGPRSGPTQNVSLRMAIDELCDDGNRLDGDGCSSDCVWRDALVPPCEVSAAYPKAT